MSDYTPTTKDVRSAASRALGGDWFDRWLVAHDAEVRASVLAEQDEPEWEYARRGVQPGVILAPDSSYEESVKRVEAAGGRRYQQVVRRRKAGPWVPVEENGESNA